MKVKEALKRIQRIQHPLDSPLVVGTAVQELKERLAADIAPVPNGEDINHPKTGEFYISVSEEHFIETSDTEEKQDLGPRVSFRIREDGSGWIIASRSNLLFGFVCFLLDELSGQEIPYFHDGKTFIPAFNWQRVSYDFFLTQEGRIQRNLNRETYIRELARLGFTHIEVNGLAFPMAPETGPKGEIYPMFYTYCPALDQFVSSKLNHGLYPEDYLSANLHALKQNAELAVRYGLTPGLLCFEPRSVPEQFFEKYPMLRGARVDHPFRSFKPRYTMTVVHPLVQEHYAEMMKKLMEEAPELGFLAIWTNDSGAGFEHTKSLYVGRNGGAYLIREWKDDEEIARLAGENALRFFRLLRDAARETNPEFRVMTRLESFYGEHDVVWKGLEDGLDAEAASLIARGWDMPYTHPKYPDNRAINAGSIYQMAFDEREKSRMSALTEKGARPHFYFTAGPHAIFEPLLGVPYPILTYQRLKMLHDNGVDYLAHSGGTFPPELVPYNINHEIARRFQWNPTMDIEETLDSIALGWAGEDFYNHLVGAWMLAEKAILGFPNVTPLYSTHGFTWYRLWERPFVPNIENIPGDQRAYYENFMCTTPHNPNNVDLSRDVLFRLTTPEKSQLDVERIDKHVWNPLDEAIRILRDIREDVSCRLGDGNVIRDQHVRLRALRCWVMTQRNVAAWIAGIYGYMESNQDSEKKKHRDCLKDMMGKEIENTRQLMELLDSGIEFLALTDLDETPLIHGNNLKPLLEERIRLMKEHVDDEPHIDPYYMMRRAGELIPKK